MRIGELATATGTTVETIRYYEKEGLLPAPERGLNNYRSYGPLQLERLRLIRNCRALDMTQEEIRAILSLADNHQNGGCGDQRAVRRAHLARGRAHRRADPAQDPADGTAPALPVGAARRRGLRHSAWLGEMQVEERQERHTHLG